MLDSQARSRIPPAYRGGTKKHHLAGLSGLDLHDDAVTVSLPPLAVATCNPHRGDPPKSLFCA